MNLHFSIDGEWLTEFSRTRFMEGHLDHAIDTLQCLDGIPFDNIINIIKGSQKLAGVNDLYLEDDIPTDDYLNDIKFMFGGTVKDNGRYLRPYAKVSKFGPNDLKSPHLLTSGSDDRNCISNTGLTDVSASIRALYYAKNPNKDIIKYLSIDGVDHPVIFEEISNFPYLIVDANVDYQTALDEYLSVRSLDDYGHDDYETEIEIDIKAVTEKPTFFKKVVVKDHEESIKEYKKIIDQQAEGDYIELSYIDGYDENNEKTVLIPRAPFEHWCLRGTSEYASAKEWTPVSPSGMKMFNDDPYHTDFLIGAGMDIRSMCDPYSDFTKAVFNLRYDYSNMFLYGNCDVLSGSGNGEYNIVHYKKGVELTKNDIIIVPDLNPRYLPLTEKAGAIITERGGSTAHLVTVLRGEDYKILRIQDARTIYKEGCRVEVNCSRRFVKFMKY